MRLEQHALEGGRVVQGLSDIKGLGYFEARLAVEVRGLKGEIRSLNTFAQKTENWK